MLAQPQQLRRGEPGHRQIAGDRAELPHVFEFGALDLAAAVVPQDRRAQHAALRIQHGGAVHLPAESDRLDRGRIQTLLHGDQHQPIHRLQCGLPPVFGILLGPAWPRPRDRQRLAGAGTQRAVAIEQHRLDRGGAEIDADEHQSCSGWRSRIVIVLNRG
jgi:hypothetical protein